ncbi:MAG: 5-(carboxyamino)imidazole ribonucleotide synthase [Qipengyuania sp.]|jgi:5-(carboxyamino)imidazole ribonucleotide synthase
MLGRGGTIGILGGGQLGRMMAMSAAQLGYRCIAYAPEGDNVVSQVCDDVFHNKWDDNAALAAFAAQCDVVTWEFENVPVPTAQAMPAGRIFPHPRALETAQDRLAEKRFVEDLGGPRRMRGSIRAPISKPRSIGWGCPASSRRGAMAMTARASGGSVRTAMSRG